MEPQPGSPGRGFAVAALLAYLAATAGIVLMSLDYQNAIGNSGLGDWTLRGAIVVGGAFGVPLLLATFCMRGDRKDVDDLAMAVGRIARCPEARS